MDGVKIEKLEKGELDNLSLEVWADCQTVKELAASSTPAISYVARLLHPRWTRGYAMAGDANHSTKSFYWRERTPDGDFTVYQMTHDGLSREATIDPDEYEEGLPNTIHVNGRPVYF